MAQPSFIYVLQKDNNIVSYSKDVDDFANRSSFLIGKPIIADSVTALLNKKGGNYKAVFSDKGKESNYSFSRIETSKNINLDKDVFFIQKNGKFTYASNDLSDICSNVLKETGKDISQNSVNNLFDYNKGRFDSYFEIGNDEYDTLTFHKNSKNNLTAYEHTISKYKTIYHKGSTDSLECDIIGKDKYFNFYEGRYDSGKELINWSVAKESTKKFLQDNFSFNNGKIDFNGSSGNVIEGKDFFESIDEWKKENKIRTVDPLKIVNSSKNEITPIISKERFESLSYDAIGVDERMNFYQAVKNREGELEWTKASKETVDWAGDNLKFENGRVSFNQGLEGKNDLFNNIDAWQVEQKFKYDKHVIEFIEPGFPKSLVKYRDYPVSSMIDTDELIDNFDEKVSTGQNFQENLDELSNKKLEYYRENKAELEILPTKEAQIVSNENSIDVYNEYVVKVKDTDQVLFKGDHNQSFEFFEKYDSNIAKTKEIEFSNSYINSNTTNLNSDALFHAIKLGKDGNSKFDSLIQGGHNLNAVTSAGFCIQNNIKTPKTAMEYAISVGNNEAFQKLFDKGADIEPFEKKIPIHKEMYNNIQDESFLATYSPTKQDIVGQAIYSGNEDAFKHIKDNKPEILNEKHNELYDTLKIYDDKFPPGNAISSFFDEKNSFNINSSFVIS